MSIGTVGAAARYGELNLSGRQEADSNVEFLRPSDLLRNGIRYVESGDLRTAISEIFNAVDGRAKQYALGRITWVNDHPSYQGSIWQLAHDYVIDRDLANALKTGGESRRRAQHPPFEVPSEAVVASFAKAALALFAALGEPLDLR